MIEDLQARGHRLLLEHLGGDLSARIDEEALRACSARIESQPRGIDAEGALPRIQRVRPEIFRQQVLLGLLQPVPAEEEDRNIFLVALAALPPAAVGGGDVRSS